MNTLSKMLFTSVKRRLKHRHVKIDPPPLKFFIHLAGCVIINTSHVYSGRRLIPSYWPLFPLFVFFFFLIYRYNYLTVTKNNEYVSQFQVEHMQEKKSGLKENRPLIRLRF